MDRRQFLESRLQPEAVPLKPRLQKGSCCHGGWQALLELPRVSGGRSCEPRMALQPFADRDEGVARDEHGPVGQARPLRCSVAKEPHDLGSLLELPFPNVVQVKVVTRVERWGNHRLLLPLGSPPSDRSNSMV